jgi:hypothetical protein
MYVYDKSCRFHAGKICLLKDRSSYCLVYVVVRSRESGKLYWIIYLWRFGLITGDFLSTYLMVFLLFIDVFLLFASVLNQLHPISIYIVYISVVGQPLMQRKTSYFDQTCNEFISDWVVMACLRPKPIKILLVDNCCIIINTLINHHDPIYL